MWFSLLGFVVMTDVTEALTKFIILSCDPEKDPTSEIDKEKAWAFVLSLNATTLLPAHEMELRSFIYDTNLTKYNDMSRDRNECL